MGTVTPIPSGEAILRGLAEKLNPHAPAPTIADLAAWIPRSPAEVWQALGVPFTPRTAGDPDRLDRLVISLHESYVKWCESSGRNTRTEWREHRALAFVAGWQQREVVVKPTRGAGLPRFQRVSEAEALALPGFDAPMPGPIRGQQVLPGFDVAPVGGCPSWLLSLYDQAGGETERPGRGAPLVLRVFVGALLSVPETARDGRDVRIPITVGELAEWLYPNGWDRSNRRRGWESFRQSLRNLDRLRVPIEVGGHVVGVQVVNAFVIPRSWGPRSARRSCSAWQSLLPQRAARGSTGTNSASMVLSRTALPRVPERMRRARLQRPEGPRNHEANRRAEGRPRR